MTRGRDTSGRAAHFAQRLERHPLALGIVVLLGIALMSYISVISISGVPFRNVYRMQAVVPSDAPLLKDGDEVRVAGQRAGQVRAVKLAPDRSGTLLKLELDDGPVGRDARVTVRLRGLAGSVYVDLLPGDTGRPLADGGTIPVAQAGAGTELTDVVAGFGVATRRAMARTLEAYGGGLSGRGAELNDALGDLAPALADTTPLLESMQPRPGALSETMRSFDGAARAFARPGALDLERMLPAASGAFSAIAGARGSLGTAIDELRPFEDQALITLPEADPLLADATAAMRALTPTVRSLSAALPDVERLLAQRKVLAELPRLARAASPVLKPAGPLLIELRPGAGLLSPLASPLESLSAHMAPYKQEIFLAPDGFTRWGGFKYENGQAPGARAVRFAPVLTCHRGRTPYPKPGEALNHSQECGS